MLFDFNCKRSKLGASSVDGEESLMWFLYLWAIFAVIILLFVLAIGGFRDEF